MLRLTDDQPTLWESVLRPDLFKLNEELAAVDRMLDDERFLVPFKERFHTRVGRPTVPVATYLRMMYLKRRYKIGYETLVKEVHDSFAWRRFCRLSLEESVPDDTTLIKLTHKYGDEILRELNDAVILKLKEEKLVRGKKLRIDTTVTEANIHYPTDTGLLADGVKVISRTVRRIKKLVNGVGKGFRDHTRKVKKMYLALNRVLRNRVSLSNPALVKAKEEMIGVAEDVVAEAKKVLFELEARNPSSRVRGLSQRLGGWLEATDTVIEQTWQVLGGRLHLKKRLVSIFDTKARPIRKGKLRVDTEFGRKVLLGETDHGIITTYKVLEGNPADTGLLKAAVRGHRRLFRRRLKAVAGDRGMYSLTNELWLKKGGVRQVSIPVRGKASPEKRAEQRQFWFRRLQRFRAGAEGRISVLKRLFGLDRSLMRGGNGTEIWVGQGIFAHNLWQAARIIGD